MTLIERICSDVKHDNYVAKLVSKYHYCASKVDTDPVADDYGWNYARDGMWETEKNLVDYIMGMDECRELASLYKCIYPKTMEKNSRCVESRVKVDGRWLETSKTLYSTRWNYLYIAAQSIAYNLIDQYHKSA